MACCFNAYAQQDYPQQTSPRGWMSYQNPVAMSIYLGGSFIAFKESHAVRNKIGRYGGGFDFGIGVHLYDFFHIESKLETIFTDDYGAFTETAQNTTTQEIKDLTSTLRMCKLTASAGVQTPYFLLRRKRGRAFSVAGVGNIGVNQINANRSIIDCSDCTSQDLHFNLNPFYEIGTDLRWELSPGLSNTHIMLRWRNYIGNPSLISEVILGVKLSFGFKAKRSSKKETKD